MVVQAGQEASLEVVQGQHVVEIYLVCTVTVYHQAIRRNINQVIIQKAITVKVLCFFKR